jgi:hypothetical protein
MNKMAVFVEGHTEVVFVEKLLREIAGKDKIVIDQCVVRGGSTCKRSVRTVKAARHETGQEYFVLIFDCGGDVQVKTRIGEEHETLTKNGYSRIIGLRDVRPKFTYTDITRLEAGLRRYIKTSLIPVDFILAIMEIEAWFLAETTHYQKIDPAITLPAIRATLGFDPENDDMERRANPADDLDRCYRIAGKAYQKSKAHETVEALDYARVYLEFPGRFKYAARLMGHIETFLKASPCN